MIAIPGYSIEHVYLKRGNRFTCAAIAEDSGKPVILRIVEEKKADGLLIKLLRQEYEYIQSINVEGVPLATDFIVGNEGAAIVLPLISGDLFSKTLQNSGMGIGGFLDLAIQLTEIVGKLHQNGITLRHISPDIFFLDKKTRKVILFDLQFARKNKSEDLPNKIPLTEKHYLSFISPEQTGRTTRVVDFRTDIYSLGVTFYQMLCGSLPFESDDIAGLMHAHLAKSPIGPSVINPQVPEVISSMVLKMMDKSPELRYQSTIGLKHDLEVCFKAWEANQTIPDFELGSKDISDIFFIPNKLYGRSKEIAILDEAWDKARHGEAVLMMVSGFSGIGKSALINQLKIKVENGIGHFMQGKFDQFQRDTPYYAGVEAFKSLIHQILSKSDDEIEYWNKRLNEALGINAGVIIESLPDLELIIGKPDAVLPLSSAESNNRFNLTFLKFIQSFTNEKHPLVLFLDDLQWVDIPTLKLIELVITDPETKNLLLICAYRDNEVDDSHPLMETLRSLKNQSVPYGEINLDPLGISDLNQIIADTVKEDLSKTEDLSRLILRKTAGNPFFTIAFIRSLHEDGLIKFDYINGKWDWDISHIQKQNFTENVIELVVNRIKLLNKNTQKLLQLAACLGNNFNLEALSIIYENSKESTLTELKPAIIEDLILTETSIYLTDYYSDKQEGGQNQFRFLHDRIQQAAYSLIGEDIRAVFHLNIARLLINNYSDEEKKENVFVLANQYNLGIEAIDAPDERLLASAINFEAGKKAKFSAAYQPAFKFFESGIGLLPNDSWLSNYSLTLNLYSEGAEAAYLSSNFERMESLSTIILMNSRKDLDKIKAYNIRIQAYVSAIMHEKALKETFQAFKMLGVKFPKKPGQLNIISALIETKMKLAGKSINKLLQQPQMTDKRISAIMEIISYAATPAYFVEPKLFPLMVFKQINLSLKYGNHIHTPFAYATYGLILCGSTNEFDKGQQFGNLALQMVDQLEAKEIRAKIHYLRSAFIRHWKEPYKNTFEEARESFRVGFETGDFLFGGYGIFHHVYAAHYSGTELKELKLLFDNYSGSMAKIKQSVVTNWVNVLRQMAEDLLQNTVSNGNLIGEHYNEVIVKPQLLKGKDFGGLGIHYLGKAIMNYLMGNNNEALINSMEAEKSLPSLLATIHPPIIVFYNGLSLLKAVRNADPALPTDWNSKVKKGLKKLRMWAKACPENLLHRQLLIEAEFFKVKGQKKKALSAYLYSIEVAKTNNAIQVEALAYELFADYFLINGDYINYKKYLLEARRTFLNWGAIAKVNQMDQYYEILNSDKNIIFPAFRPNDNSLGNISIDSHQMDVLSLTKASLAIAGEIHLDKLMSKLMEVVIENAGAQKGFLILQKGGDWVVEAESHVETLGDKSPRSVPIDSHEEIIEAIVQYVARTREHLVLEDVQKDSRFSGNELARKRNIRSVSCLPIINQGRLIAILYFENNLQEGVFTEKRVEFLTILSGQIAVSLENALLYQNLEQKVIERTKQIAEEKEKTDSLLLNILPATTAQELKATGFSKPRSYESATVMFTDFINFSKVCENLDADELVKVINTYYSFFDSLMEKYGLEKIKTIGDSYMCAGGLPVENETHAVDMVKAAKEMQVFVREQKSKQDKETGIAFDCRIGIHSGPVIAGIVGTKKFAYDIWGDTVNIASRLETNGMAGEVNISEATYQLVKSEFTCGPRGKIQIKNRGEIDMYFVK